MIEIFKFKNSHKLAFLVSLIFLSINAKAQTPLTAPCPNLTANLTAPVPFPSCSCVGETTYCHNIAFTDSCGNAYACSGTLPCSGGTPGPTPAPQPTPTPVPTPYVPALPSCPLPMGYVSPPGQKLGCLSGGTFNNQIAGQCQINGTYSPQVEVQLVQASPGVVNVVATFKMTTSPATAVSGCAGLPFWSYFTGAGIATVLTIDSIVVANVTDNSGVSMTPRYPLFVSSSAEEVNIYYAPITTLGNTGSTISLSFAYGVVIDDTSGVCASSVCENQTFSENTTWTGTLQ
jgi:hypothetical protein